MHLFVLVAPRGHALICKKATLDPRALRAAGVLLLDGGHCFREQALALCTTAGARELEFRATSQSTLAQMVAGGAGVTLLPELALPTELRRAALEVRRFTVPVPGRSLALVWRAQSPSAAPLQRIASRLREAYGKVVSRR